MNKEELRKIQRQKELERLTQADKSRRDLFKNQGASHAPIWLCGGIALVLSVVSIAALLPIRETGFAQLILARGWVPYVLVFMVYWSYVIMVFKVRLLGKQESAMDFDLLPVKISREITIESVPLFQSHVRTIFAGNSENFLGTRLLRGLSHYEVRGNHAETSEILVSQSEIDAHTAHSSYALLKVFIWAIPILGFIGTVVGISDAVGSFAGELGAAEDISVLKDKLGLVTAGLGVAFDTTLLALVMSVLVMFPTSILQTKEEALLTAIDDYCNENFLKRLAEDPTDKDALVAELLAHLVESHDKMVALQQETNALLRHVATGGS